MSNLSKISEIEKSIVEIVRLSKGSTDIENLKELESILEKAKKLVDEYDPNAEEEASSDYGEDQGFREFNPEDEGEDDADKWLQENEPKKTEEDEDEEPKNEDEEYDEYGPDEDEEAHQKDDEELEEPNEAQEESTKDSEEKPDVATESPTSTERQASPETDTQAAEASSSVEESADPKAQETLKEPKESRFHQPSREEIADMRQYTRPWEQSARERSRLEAEPSQNPVLHHEGKLLEARNASHKDRKSAYAAFQNSPEYKNADPISQMDMEAKFDKDWHSANPSYVANSMKSHGEAHSKGLQAKDFHAAAKDEKIRHVLTGGASPDMPMSTEEGMQHAGGAKGEEGTIASTVSDPASSFAAGNKEFINQYAKEYEKKAKRPKDLGEMHDYDAKSKADVNRILGDQPALKDAGKKAKVDDFFSKYHPLIAINAHKVLNKMGLDAKRGDVDFGMLHEAGMHGLFQAINDYDHDHPSKASFSTHASNKIRGLMQTALKGQDQIPKELRAKSKQFYQQKQAPATQVAMPQAPASAPKVDLSSMVAKHPPEVADRFKRIQTARSVQAPKMPKPEGES